MRIVRCRSSLMIFPGLSNPCGSKACLTRRITALFHPYRGRLTAVLGLIVVSAGLGMVSPFLLREVLDVAIPEKDRELLTWLVGGMIFISVATGVIAGFGADSYRLAVDWVLRSLG